MYTCTSRMTGHCNFPIGIEFKQTAQACGFCVCLQEEDLVGTFWDTHPVAVLLGHCCWHKTAHFWGREHAHLLWALVYSSCTDVCVSDCQCVLSQHSLTMAWLTISHAMRKGMMQALPYYYFLVLPESSRRAAATIPSFACA